MDGYNSGQGERSMEYVCAFQNDFSKPLQNKFGWMIRTRLMLSPDGSDLEGEGGREGEKGEDCLCFVFSGLQPARPPQISLSSLALISLNHTVACLERDR